jgi:DNA-binding NtrC family response regulator
MRANAEVLILEDDAETLDELKQRFAAKRFHPLAARTATHALSMLENNARSTRPVLAIVDWDLSKAPDNRWSSGDVLAHLSRDLSDCMVIVYSANIDSFRVRSDIQRAHPRAWLHDKRDGHESLISRVDRVLDQTVGDLKVEDGSLVVHMPTLAEHHHREAVRLVAHYPDVVTLHSDTATKAVRRFGEWLVKHDSSMAVISHGNRKYRLGESAARVAARRVNGVR